MEQKNQSTCLNCQALNLKPTYKFDFNICDCCINCNLDQLVQINQKTIAKNSKKEYPKSINQIDEYLFVGNYEAAADIKLLQELGITHILVAAAFLMKMYPNNFTYHQIDIVDSEEQDILPYLEECNKFINSAIQKGEKVFIHCAQGAHRSPSIAIANIMQRTKQSFEEVFEYSKKKRPQIRLNENFIKQLQQYEKLQCSKLEIKT